MPTAQINIPGDIYGRCDWMIYKPMSDWLSANKLDYRFVGTTSTGSGENTEYVYMSYDCDAESMTAFKIQFPHCKVHIVDVQS